MIPTEVNIGDLIYDTMCGDNYPAKISVEDFAIEARDGTHPFSIYEPIPLTTNILFANGFVHGHDNCYFLTNFIGEESEILIKLYESCFSLSISINTYTNDAMFEKSNLHYVHELQHVLRVCGLHDFANQFKLHK